MIGSWKGQGIPTANRLKGWPEKHMWAWKFAKGVPGRDVADVLEGDKTLGQGRADLDAAGKQYRLEGTDPAGKAVVYVGTYGGTSSSKMLTLDRVGETSEGKERIVIWPNSNLIRYALWLEHQDPGAPQFKRVIEVGLTKEGESFAAGGSAADLPKCIITGGAATMTVSYQGKSYPICCSGCRDEFNDNPEKYVKKAALRAEQGGARRPSRPPPRARARTTAPSPASATKPKPKSKPAPGPRPAPKADRSPPPIRRSAESPKADEGAGKDEAKAASLLRLGQNLEKSGKPAAALPYYQRSREGTPRLPPRPRPPPRGSRPSAETDRT